MIRVALIDDSPFVQRLLTAYLSRARGVQVIGAVGDADAAIERILTDLDPVTSDAVIIVQHLPAAFTQSLMHQLQSRTSLPIEEARHGTALASGRIYLAPGGCHLRLAQPTPRGAVHIELEDGPAIHGHLPCIDATMQSAAALLGPRAVGILLSGMGSNGANGIAAIHAAGGDTLAQDASTCVIFGMPQRAIERQAVNFSGTPEQIARRVNRASRLPLGTGTDAATSATAGVSE